MFKVKMPSYTDSTMVEEMDKSRRFLDLDTIFSIMVITLHTCCLRDFRGRQVINISSIAVFHRLYRVLVSSLSLASRCDYRKVL